MIHNIVSKIDNGSVKFADIATIDLAEYDRPGGVQRLAQQLKQHVHELGTRLQFQSKEKN